MRNGQIVRDALVNLISKIGEKITIRRTHFFDKSRGQNYFYVHSAVEKNNDLGSKLAMHIAASNPLAIDKDGIDKNIVNKELEIIKAEIINSGKPPELAEKISKGKISKFLNENSLLNQIWIMDPKKTVQDILNDSSSGKKINVLDFVKYKVGEGI